MIILIIVIIWYILLKWSVRHIHTDYTHPTYCSYIKNGDIVYWRGCRCTAIDVKTVDLVLRRHLIGLLYRWPKDRVPGIRIR